MKKLQDLTEDELENMSDDELAQIEWENGGSGILPWGSRAQQLKNNSRDKITISLSENGYGYVIGERELGNDNAVTVPYDLSLHEKLKGLDSECQAVRVDAAKFVSKLLNN